jgi:hypothetical protein
MATADDFSPMACPKFKQSRDAIPVAFFRRPGSAHLGSVTLRRACGDDDVLSLATVG